MSKKNKKTKPSKYRRVLIVTFLIIVLSIPSLFFNLNKEKPQELKYKEFIEMVDNRQVKKIEWTENSEKITVVGKDKKEYLTENPKYENFKKDMLENGIKVVEKGGIEKYETMIMMVIQVTIYSILFSLLIKGTGIGANLSKKKEKDAVSEVKFSDVAGLEEVKEDLMTVVDFLKSPDKYKEAGAETPKGILLYGPPGTGKTLLAKAVAGEAGVKFKAVSGSDFDEKYVGVGASKMRKMFEDAKNNAPCIIFIDEIDSMGGKRHSKQSNSDRQTLNSLLSEMDGFDGSNGVVVIAATNRIEDLDSALTRPGRFDNHFAVGLPETAKERKIIIDLYSNNKKFSDDINLDNFAKETMGSSPASIKTVLNEAAIIATRKNDGIITKSILDESWMKHLMEGHLKKNGEKDNAKIIAWHEAGHALAGLLLGQDLTKVSIIQSTSGAGGATFITPKKLGLFTKKELEEQIIVLYAGRNAEKMLTGDTNLITTGASNDIEKATSIVQKMITDYGMSETFGAINLDNMDVKPELIINEVIKIAKNLEAKSYYLLEDNRDTLKAIAEELLNKEILTGNEIKTIAAKTARTKEV